MASTGAGQNGGVFTAPGVHRHGDDLAPRLHLAYGADIGWNPVTNLNFDLELMYQHVPRMPPAETSEPSTAPALSFPALGKATAAVSRAVSASPATSDRIPVS